MGFPDYPSNRLIVDGIDLTKKFKMILSDGYTLNPPALKTYSVDIPGGNGTIDLTETLTGDVSYKNREQEFTFYVIDIDNFEKVKTDVNTFLHGRSFDYTMTMDPGYTYHGRFTISDCSHKRYTIGKVGCIKLKVDADPYKKRKDIVRSINAYGGAMFSLESGRLPVRPTIEVNSDCRIIFNGKTIKLSRGSWIVHDIIFRQGMNQLYVCTQDVRSTTWGSLKTHGVTFGDFGQRRLYEWYKAECIDEVESNVVIKYEWYDL